jgi:hypothetical protein
LQKTDAAMAYYTFHDLTLAVHTDWAELEEEVAQLLEDLSFVCTPVSVNTPSLRLSLSRSDCGLQLPPERTVFEAEGVCGLENGEDFYLTDGASVLQLHAHSGYGEAQIASSFFTHSLGLRRSFWAFGLLKLLRPPGRYSLQQSVTYELEAGHDLYEHPARLVDLLREAEGARPWRA